MAEAKPQVNPGATPTRGVSDAVPSTNMVENFTPAQIVAELDRYIIGQNDAKRAVAVALRNRYRRQLLPEDMRQEVQPKNILMIGPTGVGKTEIARRVARLMDAPFIKVEATKFTEVGYVGRDVESIIRDLVEVAITNLHDQRMEQVKEQATQAAVDRLADMLTNQALERRSSRTSKNGRTGKNGKSETDSEPGADDAPPENADAKRDEAPDPAIERRRKRERKRLLQLLTQEAIEEETVEIELEEEGFDENPLELFNGMSPDDLQDSFQDFLDGFMPRRPSRRRVSVREARRILTQQEANRMVDFDAVVEAAVRRVEEAAVVFIDEIDKTISSDGEYGGEVSGQGVQRDLLPIVEGSVVMTRYGPVRSDHVLFIAAGAFHNSRPSDLIPELQGRFPIRVELQSLTEDDLYRILTEPRNALTKQYAALLATEGLTLDFSGEGLREMAKVATQVNATNEDIGARRLHTIMERVLEELSFDASDRSGQHVEIDRAFVQSRIGPITEDEDLSNYIL